MFRDFLTIVKIPEMYGVQTVLDFEKLVIGYEYATRYTIFSTKLREWCLKKYITHTTPWSWGFILANYSNNWQMDIIAFIYKKRFLNGE